MRQVVSLVKHWGDEAVVDGREARAARTRERVVRAAQELIEEGGPAAITYSALAERSGVGRATLYRHWPELADLWRDLRGEMVGRLQAQLSGDLAVDLPLVMGQMTRMLGGAGGSSLITLLERARWDPETRAQVAAAERSNPVRLALGAAQQRGQLAADADLAALSALLLGPLLYRALMTQRPVDDAYAEAVAAAVLDAWGPGGTARALRLP